MSLRFRWSLLFVAALVLAACGGDDDPSPQDPIEDVVEDPGVDTEDTQDTEEDGSEEVSPDVELDTDTEEVTEPEGPNPDCDPLDPHYCQFPWPSSLYLEEDASRATGYTLRFGETTLPTNGRNEHVAPEDYARLDGYGPGSYVLTFFPNLDDNHFGEPGRAFPSEYESMGDSMLEDAPILWFEDTGEGLIRVPFYAELDHRQSNPERKILIVRPGVILKEDTRYVVAFRDLVDREGAAIPSSEAFAALRDGEAGEDPLLAPRVDRFEAVFADLETAGVDRQDLILAWDFHTASSDGLHGPILHMRDDALERTDQLGAELSFDWENAEFQNEGSNGEMMRVSGTFTVPNYLVEERVSAQGSGWRLNFDDNWRPQVNPDQPTFTGEIWLSIPRAAVEAESGTGLVMYGHGLNGSGTQVYGGFNTRMGNDYNLIFYGIDMAGMSGNDVGGILYFVGRFTYFRWLVDRMHQGMVNHVLVARAMRDRFPEMQELADLDISIDTERFYYSGISQGGIYGQSFVALSPDITRGHCGVPGNNYSTLLERSVDFDPFFAIMTLNYTTREKQLSMLTTIQQLWDTVDPVSYLHRLANPFPGQEPSQVILAPARGDYQVAVFTNEIAARSNIGVALMENYDRDYTPWGIEQQPYGEEGFEGSAVVGWDFSNPWPPIGNITPDDCYGDPHGLGRNRHEDHNVQMEHFWRTGRVIDVCNGEPCFFPRDPNPNRCPSE